MDKQAIQMSPERYELEEEDQEFVETPIATNKTSGKRKSPEEFTDPEKNKKAMAIHNSESEEEQQQLIQDIQPTKLSKTQEIQINNRKEQELLSKSQKVAKPDQEVFLRPEKTVKTAKKQPKQKPVDPETREKVENWMRGTENVQTKEVVHEVVPAVVNSPQQSRSHNEQPLRAKEVQKEVPEDIADENLENTSQTVVAKPNPKGKKGPKNPAPSRILRSKTQPEGT